MPGVMHFSSASGPKRTWAGALHMSAFGGERGTFDARTERIRVYIAKPGPLGTILMISIVGLLSAVLLVLLLGALLIWLPAIVLFVTAAIVAGLLRAYFQRRL